MTNLESWAAVELSRFGYQSPKEIVSYLFQDEKDSSVEEYLNAVLDKEDPEHLKFINEFLHRYNELKSSVGPGFYRKPDFDDKGKIDNGRSKIKEKPLPAIQNKAQNNTTSSTSKKKNKYVALYSEEGHKKDVVLLSGRHKCDCQASKHKLINNCMKCGRIVCEQEGSGPCAFCQNLVMSKEEQEIINRGTKKSETLHNKLIHSKKVIDNDESVSKGLRRAIDHKNKLLEYDKTSEKRTKVYDDENDYFQSNSRWVNPADREKLQKYEEEMKQKKYDRNNTKYTIDILGRKVVSKEESIVYNPDDPFLNEIFNEGKADIYSYGENEEVCHLLNLPRPVYIETISNNGIAGKICNISNNGLQRIQDRELQEMRDEGMCLSMHQPWASLLIAGIKIHEGRTWYHSHRGRLWIASTSKVPTPQDITQLEQTYRIILKDENLTFPKHYPSGCLLGCVDVIDVLPQEEYRRQFPEGESDSPYVFVCENPQEMIIKFPIKGKHKIYKLEGKIHEAAMKSLKIM